MPEHVDLFNDDKKCNATPIFEHLIDNRRVKSIAVTLKCRRVLRHTAHRFNERFGGDDAVMTTLDW